MPEQPEQKKESKEINLKHFDPETASHDELLKATYLQNKKILKRLFFLSLAGYIRLFFVYIPLIAATVLGIIFLPDIIQEMMDRYISTVTAGVSTESIKDILPSFGTERFNEIRSQLSK
jgi:hypothetical protein